MTRTQKVFASTGVGLLAIAGINFAVINGGATPPPLSSSSAAARPALVAGPGRVEPASEEIRVTAQLSGRLDQVRVEEGDSVVAGQVIAVVANDDYRARVASAEATLRAREADARRIVNGARTEERLEA